MAILQTDIILKSALEAVLEDTKKNLWLIDDIFSDYVNDVILNNEYGAKEIQTIKEWFSNVQIPVLLQGRVADDPPIPCVGISYSSEMELIDRAGFSDIDDTTNYDISNILKEANKIYKNVSLTYNATDGRTTVNTNKPLKNVLPGDLVISKNGNMYTIISVLDNNIIILPKNIIDDFTTVSIIERTSLWNCNRGYTYFKSSFQIGCYANGQPSYTIWLHNILLYGLLRLKFLYLDARGIELSAVNSTNLMLDPNFIADKVYTKFINIDFIYKVSWINYLSPKLSYVFGKINFS